MKAIKMLIAFLFVVFLIILSPVLILAALVALPLAWITKDTYEVLWGDD